MRSPEVEQERSRRRSRELMEVKQHVTPVRHRHPSHLILHQQLSHPAGLLELLQEGQQPRNVRGSSDVLRVEFEVSLQVPRQLLVDPLDVALEPIGRKQDRSFPHYLCQTLRVLVRPAGIIHELSSVHEAEKNLLSGGVERRRKLDEGGSEDSERAMPLRCQLRRVLKESRAGEEGEGLVLEEDIGEGNFRHDELGGGGGGSEWKGGGEAAEEATEDKKVRAAHDLLLSLLQDPSHPAEDLKVGMSVSEFSEGGGDEGEGGQRLLFHPHVEHHCHYEVEHPPLTRRQQQLPCYLLLLLLLLELLLLLLQREGGENVNDMGGGEGAQRVLADGGEQKLLERGRQLP
mmetsp:Transcript_19608/g.65264  ORF Transcript_19608/g.65264 Transcript_19608/m.65264 type:complete len:345 (+) Transcript_19608:143-1177(+)